MMHGHINIKFIHVHWVEVCLFIYWRTASCLLWWWHNKLIKLIKMKAKMNSLLTRSLYCFLCSLTSNENMQYTETIEWNYKDFKGRVSKFLLCTGCEEVLANEYTSHMRQECHKSKFGIFELLIYKETFAGALWTGIVS